MSWLKYKGFGEVVRFIARLICKYGPRDKYGNDHRWGDTELFGHDIHGDPIPGRICERCGLRETL